MYEYEHDTVRCIGSGWMCNMSDESAHLFSPLLVLLPRLADVYTLTRSDRNYCENNSSLVIIGHYDTSVFISYAWIKFLTITSWEPILFPRSLQTSHVSQDVCLLFASDFEEQWMEWSFLLDNSYSLNFDKVTCSMGRIGRPFYRERKKRGSR